MTFRAAPHVVVAVFPGTWSERDFAQVGELLGWRVRLAWHTETDLGAPDAVVLPGGFAHGDHLRTGAIARFSPIMGPIGELADRGVPVMGSCNGFQILTEASLLPGALLRNDSLEYRCDWQWLRVDAPVGPFLFDIGPEALIRLPISHGQGRYYADPDTLDELESTGRIVLRYTDVEGRATPNANPNGSLRNIAGIVNAAGNVLGLMPHPERAAELELGGEDGLRLFRALVRWLERQPAAAERRA